MRTKIMTIMAAAVLFLPTIAHAQPSEGRGIYHRDDLKNARDDVRANSKPTVVRDSSIRMIKLNDCALAVGAPGSLMGLPRDVITPLVPKEIENARTAPDCGIAGDPELLQYLPPGYFNYPGGKAALARVARYENATYAESVVGKAALANRLLSLFPTSATFASTGAVNDPVRQLQIQRRGTTERIDMYPCMVRRYEAKRPINNVRIGDEDLVFVQPGENPRVVYIGAFNKTGGNVGGNDSSAGSTTVVAQAGDGGNTADHIGGNDKQGGKTGGMTNVILEDADHEPIANIMVVALPSYLRDDEGVVRVLKNGRSDTYWCRNGYCPLVPLPVPR
jgi:hypothetical protein